MRQELDRALRTIILTVGSPRFEDDLPKLATAEFHRVRKDPDAPERRKHAR